MAQTNLKTNEFKVSKNNLAVIEKNSEFKKSALKQWLLKHASENKLIGVY